MRRVRKPASASLPEPPAAWASKSQCEINRGEPPPWRVRFTQTKANAKQTLQESAGAGGWEKAVSAQVGRRSIDQVPKSKVQRDIGTGLSPGSRSQTIRPDGARHGSA